MARSFSAAGMKVAVADIEQKALNAVAAEFAASNADVITLQVDVTDRNAMEKAADATEAAFGKVHVICNNAGVVVAGPIDEMTYEDRDWVVGVNLDGVFNGVRTFTRRIEAHGEGGHILNTASMAGHFAAGGRSVYTAPKYAVVGLSESMRVDLSSKNIGVSVLCPGLVRTNIFASGRTRPAALSHGKNTASDRRLDAASDSERGARLKELPASALDPAVVGDMVLHAILNDEFYIFTHPWVQSMAARASEMVSSLERWRRYCSEHGI